MSFYSKLFLFWILSVTSVYVNGIKERSPINLKLYFDDLHGTSNIKYPSFAKMVLNETIYQPLANIKFNTTCDKEDFSQFSCTGSTTKQIMMNAEGLGRIYVTLYNHSLSYNTKQIYLKIFAEHAVEDTMSDLELQIIHELDLESYNNFRELKEENEKDNEQIKSKCNFTQCPPQNLTLSLDFQDYQYVGISIRYSAIRDKKSKDDFIKEIGGFSSIGDYDFTSIEFADLNQYFKKGTTYYHYQGTGTTDATKNTKVQWFLLNDVQDMSIEEFDDIQRAYISQCPGEKIGNARPYTIYNNPSEMPEVTFFMKKESYKEK